MQNIPTDLDIGLLTVDQRLELISRLWESIPADETPIPDWHRRELERRLAAARENPDAVVPWETVLERLQRRP